MLYANESLRTRIRKGASIGSSANLLYAILLPKTIYGVNIVNADKLAWVYGLGFRVWAILYPKPKHLINQCLLYADNLSNSSK
jgi:hypothetical protein